MTDDLTRGTDHRPVGDEFISRRGSRRAATEETVMSHFYRRLRRTGKALLRGIKALRVVLDLVVKIGRLLAMLSFL